MQSGLKTQRPTPALGVADGDSLRERETAFGGSAARLPILPSTSVACFQSVPLLSLRLKRSFPLALLGGGVGKPPTQKTLPLETLGRFIFGGSPQLLKVARGRATF